MTDKHLDAMEKGYAQFSERHDHEGEESVWKLRYFIRLAYVFGYVNGQTGKDPSNV